MKFILKKSLVTILVAFVLFLPVLHFISAAGGTIDNPIKVSTVNEFIKILLEGVIKIGLPIVALAIIYSGFLFVSARGNSESLKKAKDSLLYSIIGAAILLGAWAIAQLISDTVLEIGKNS